VNPEPGGGMRLGPVISILLLIGVAAGVWWSATHKSGTATGTPAAAQATVITGLVGSEKMAFFSDPRVQAAFKAKGFSVAVEKAGSREIAAHPHLHSVDFAFPAGEPAGVKIQQVMKTAKASTPWYTVMTVASWKPIAGILAANGIVRQEDGYWYILDLRGLLQLAADGKRWKDLKDSGAYSIGRTVLVSTTDVQKSNSAAMFLSLASYLFNDDNVVQSQDEVNKVVPKVAPLFLKQGFQENSSAGPFEDYTMMGMGKTPLVMVYEAQFIEELIHSPQAANRDQMVLLYPRPTIYAKQMFIPFNAGGERLGELLESDPELLQLAAEYGWRTRDSAGEATLWTKAGVKVPPNLVDVINPPRYEIVESLIDGIAAAH
jgi:hypothetical protein